MNKPIITLKNVKHNASMSHETQCFSATVYVDGKKFCTVEDSGHGGCINDDADHDEVHQLMVQLNPNAVRWHGDVDKSEKHEWPYADDWHLVHSMTSASVFEIVVGEALSTWLFEKDIKNDLRHRYVVIKANSTDNDASINLYAKKQFNGLDFEQIKQKIEIHMEHEVEFLNNWDLVDVRAAYELDAAA